MISVESAFTEKEDEEGMKAEVVVAVVAEAAEEEEDDEEEDEKEEKGVSSSADRLFEVVLFPLLDDILLGAEQISL